MTPISSRANPLFKRLRLLLGSAQRQRKEGVAVLEGVHLSDAYLQAAATPGSAMPGAFESAVVSASARSHPEVAALVTRLTDVHGPHAPIACFDDALFEQLSPVNNGGLGLMLLVAIPACTMPTTLVENCIVLDAVQDAGNVGSILRTAAAAGVAWAFCTPGTANVWSVKVLRAAMGAHFAMSIVEDVDIDQFTEHVQAPVIITDLQAAQPLYDTDLRRPLAWVMGNEGAGVSAAWRNKASLRVIIPQPGRIESLNVAAAAAVCLFEQARQQRAGA